MTRPERPSDPPPPFASIARLAGARGAALWTALAYFAVVAALGLVFHVTGDLESESDFFDSYVVQARAFLDGAIAVDPYRGPVYPILLALFSLPMGLVGAGMFEAGIVLSALSAAVTLYFTQRLLSRWLSAPVALAATLLAALNWVFVRYSYTTGNDMPFAALATAALCAFFAPRAGTRLRPLALGILCGVVYLTRYNGVALPLVMFAGVLLFDLWDLPWKRRVRACVLLAAGFAAVLSPWALYCKAETGRYVYNENYRNVAYGAYMTTEGTTEEFLARHPGEFTGYRDVLSYDPGRLLKQVAVHFVEHTRRVLQRVLSWPLSIFTLVGLASLFRRGGNRSFGVYALAGAVFYLLLLLVFYSDRFLLFLVPIACALAAHGFVVASDAISRRTPVPPFADFALMTLLIYSAITCVAFNRPLIHGADTVFREMGETFARERPDHDRAETVVARKAYFGYFAGLTTAPLPLVSSHDELMAYLRRVGADYLFFSYVAYNTREALTYLSYPDRPHPGLVPLAMAPPTSEGSFRGVLYRVEKDGAAPAHPTGEE
jgi:uncharacterized membrane protein YvlD (DUF360 family)